MNETLYDLEQKRKAVKNDIEALFETLQKENAQTDQILSISIQKITPQVIFGAVTASAVICA